jgi:mannose-6-phosphate isomerase
MERGARGRPYLMRSNRVRRTYIGGLMIDRWQHNPDPKDSSCPEEWIASVVEANNPAWDHIDGEGLTLLEDDDKGEIKLRDFIEDDPAGVLGHQHVEKFGANPSILIKALDSAERLAVQVHPDSAGAKRIFNSAYGKTEAWYVIDQRELDDAGPSIYLGFKEGINRKKWEDLFYRQDIPAMLASLHHLKACKGDTFLVEGGVPHAIGKGCFVVEIQEPTDFTFRTDRVNDRGMEVTDEMCHCGAGFRNMFDSFRYEGLSEKEVLRLWRIEPGGQRETESARETILIGKEKTDKFSLHLVELYKEFSPAPRNSFYVLIVAEGSCRIVWRGGEVEALRGRSVFIPYNVPRIRIFPDGENCKLIECRPPAG